MAIVQTVDYRAFVQAFAAYGRKDQYSPAALRMIFDYLEEYSESTGEPVELDVIGICCEFSECSYDDVVQDYSIDVSEYAPHDEQARKDAILDYLQDNTMLVGYNDEIIVFMAF